MIFNKVIDIFKKQGFKVFNSQSPLTLDKDEKLIDNNSIELMRSDVDNINIHQTTKGMFIEDPINGSIQIDSYDEPMLLDYINRYTTNYMNELKQSKGDIIKEVEDFLKNIEPSVVNTITEANEESTFEDAYEMLDAAKYSIQEAIDNLQQAKNSIRHITTGYNMSGNIDAYVINHLEEHLKTIDEYITHIEKIQGKIDTEEDLTQL